jgi:hypothetical protein
MPKDFLDGLLSDDASAAPVDTSRCICVTPPCRDSRELEARAAAMQRDLWSPCGIGFPIPFVNENGETEPLTKDQVEHLATLGFTEDDWLSIVGKYMTED